MIKNWSEKFILFKIADNIICLKNSDYHEHEKYTVNLQNKNYENDFDIIQNKIFQICNQNFLLIDFIYINVNEEQIDLNLKLINAFLKMIISKSFQINKTTSASNKFVYI